MMRPLTKFTKQIVHGNNIPVLVHEAMRLAREERPGAVHLELPEDIAAEECSAVPLNTVSTRRPTADDKAIDQAVEMIHASKLPLILIGAGANRNRISEALVKLLNKTGMYCFNTQMGKGVVDEGQPYFLGTAALSSKDYLHCAVDRADLIINVGHDVIEKPPFFMSEDGANVIHVNYFSSNVDEVYFPQLDVVGDIAGTIEKLVSKVDKCATLGLQLF